MIDVADLVFTNPAAPSPLPWIGVLLGIDGARSRALLPAIIFLDLSILGPLFMAGVYFFEKVFRYSDRAWRQRRGAQALDSDEGA